MTPGVMKADNPAQREQLEKAEEKRLAIMMMKKKDKYLYDKIMFGKKRKVREVCPISCRSDMDFHHNKSVCTDKSHICHNVLFTMPALLSLRCGNVKDLSKRVSSRMYRPCDLGVTSLLQPNLCLLGSFVLSHRRTSLPPRGKLTMTMKRQ